MPDTRQPVGARVAGLRAGTASQPARRRPLWRGRPVLQFVAIGTVILGVLVAAICLLAERAALNEAARDARTRTTLLERSVVRPELPRGLATGQPAAVAAFNTIVHRQILGGWLVRVKVWNADGTIVYSDEPRLIGLRFSLGSKEQALLRSGQVGTVEGGLSDLDEPENRFEQANRRLYEAYALTRSPEGQPLLFETYYRYSDVSDRSDEVLHGFLPISIGALLLFEIVTLPLVWRLARRIRSGREERERLLRKAVEASDAERRRIAADLHDGVVQELAGASFALAAAAKSLHGEPAVGASLDRVAAGVRQSMRSLRSLLVEIYPPNLHTEGLAAALGDLLAPLPDSGMSTSLAVPDQLDVPHDVAAVLFRVAQETVRNAQRHSGAGLLTVTVTREPAAVVLTVRDDGRGFVAAEPPADGHVGLRLLRDLAVEVGATFTVSSQAGIGTTVTLTVPLEPAA